MDGGVRVRRIVAYSTCWETVEEMQKDLEILTIGPTTGRGRARWRFGGETPSAVFKRGIAPKRTRKNPSARKEVEADT